MIYQYICTAVWRLIYARPLSDRDLRIDTTLLEEKVYFKVCYQVLRSIYFSCRSCQRPDICLGAAPVVGDDGGGLYDGLRTMRSVYNRPVLVWRNTSSMAVGPSTMIAINREQNDTIIPEHRDVFRDDAASENEGRRSGRATLGYHIYLYMYTSTTSQ